MITVEYELSHKPELLAHTKRGQTMMMSGQNTFATAGAQTLSGTTQHWKSVYNQANDVTLSQENNRSRRPEWSMNRQAYSSKRSWFETEYARSLGIYGHNPRDKLNAQSTEQKVDVDALNIGTAKTTFNIPGYTGFIPKTDFNEKANAQSQVENVRNTIVKQNIVENYQVKLPGYSGHKPMCAVNDRGQPRPSCLST